MWGVALEIVLLVLRWGFAFWTGRAEAAKTAKERVRDLQRKKLEDVEAVLSETDSEKLSRAGYVRGRVIRELLRERRMRLKKSQSSD